MTRKQIFDRMGGFVDGLFLDIPKLLKPFLVRPRQIDRASYEREMDFYLDQGYVDAPETFFRQPDPIPSWTIESETPYRGGTCQHIRYNSSYEPVNPDVRPRFLSHQANRTGWLVRWTHGDPGRKTVLCLHGYMLGEPNQAERMFRVRSLFDQGLDAALFVAPFHWRRAAGSTAERGIYLRPDDPAMTAECIGQTMYDLHGCLALLGELEAGEIGLVGASMGGYNAALFACLSQAASFAAMMVPAVSYTKPMGPDSVRLPFEPGDALRLKIHRVWEFHSPLRLEPRLPLDRLLFIASRGDRICPFEYVRALVEKWGRPEHHFHTGGHWLIFNRKARGRAWYSFLARMGFLPER